MSRASMDDLALNDSAHDLDSLSVEIGEWAEGHGFREDWALSVWLNDLANRICKAQDESDFPDEVDAEILRKAAEALRTNILGMKLMLSVSELSEALDSLRKVGAKGVLSGEGNFNEELADTHIRLFDLSHMINPVKELKTVGDEVVDKIKVNRNRPYKHGKKF